MADSPEKIKRVNDLYNEQIRILQGKNEEIAKELSSIENLLDMKKRIALEDEYRKNNQEVVNELLREYNAASKRGADISEDVTNELNKQVKSYEEINKRQKTSISLQQELLRAKQKTVGILKMTYKYLNDNDKIIRQTILSLGLSAGKAAEMRTSFEDSAAFVARLGGNLSDVQSIMQMYADETGRARALSAEMVEDAFLIGRGTGLGVEQGARLAAQFELMGLNATNAMTEVQGIVETSELMGVNTTKVLKNISDNFRRLQRFTFRAGVQGFAEMAQHAEKFHIDMSQTLDSAANLRNLESAIDAAARLQVLGGRFGETDGLRMLFAVRNEPEEFQKMINQMVSGMATFRKQADGTFESFISPADLDRMAAAEQALGLQAGELQKQARRLNEIQLMRQRMVGMGLSDAEKTLIEGMAMFNKETGRFTVQIAGQSKSIQEITKQELKVLEKQSESLKERAERAQTFDEVYRATIEEFKTILLPLLQNVNVILDKVRPVADSLNEWFRNLRETEGGWLKIAGTLMGAAVLFRTVSLALKGVVGGLGDRLGGIARRTVGGKTKTTLSGSQMLGRGKMISGAGSGALKAGAGIGAAGLGVGAGIGIAAKGISELADAMSKLDEEQAENLKEIVISLSILSGVAIAASVGIAAIGAAGTGAAVGLLAFGGAMLMVGGGIALATKGIGTMAEGLAVLNKSGGNAGKQLLGVAAGVGALSTVMAAGGIPMLFAFNNALGRMAKKSDDLDDIGTAFANINAVLSGGEGTYREVENTLSRIAAMDFSNVSALNKIGNIFEKPLKVEFADKEVGMVANISLNVDGYKMYEKTNAVNYLVDRQVDYKRGKGASRG